MRTPSIAVTGIFAGRCQASARKRCASRKVCGTKRAWNRKAAAFGSFRGGRERPPYNPPQMGAGERNVGRKGKVPGFACRLPCTVGRAISPAGEPGGRRKAAGKIDAHPKHCGDRQLCGTMPSIVPYAGFRLPSRAAQGPSSGSYTGAAHRGASETPPAGGSDLIGPETPRSRETLQGKAGIGPGRLGQPEVTAAGVNARPTILHKWVPGKETAAAKAKFPVSPAVCLVL